MAVIRVSGPDDATQTLRRHLAGLLYKELMGEATRRGPVIFEDPVAPREINVIVVWEAWRGIPTAERNAMIREAYSLYRQTLENGVHWITPPAQPDPPMVPKVMATTGATWDEAVDLGLLPYSIHPTVEPPGCDLGDLETVMLDAGALETPEGVQLRLPNQTLASLVHARLMHGTPEARWTIREVASVED